MEWIRVEDRKPEDGRYVLIHIILQYMRGGVHTEEEVIVTGGIKDGDWFVGNELMMWDYSYNLDFTDDDVTHWMPLPDKPSVNCP